MKIKELISILQDIEKEFGNKEVYLSRDSEGNGFGTLDAKGSFSIGKEDNQLILFPWEEGIELD